MNTEDFPIGQSSVTRLRAAKDTVSRFVGGRPDDVLGLVVFANYPGTACPLTLDRTFLLDAQFARFAPAALPATMAQISAPALVWSIDLIKDAVPKKKVVILLTDGRNAPAGPDPPDPVRAATLASRFGVTVHTIAVGKRQDEAAGASDPRAAEDGPDFAALERIAEAGGGHAFAAANAGELDRVFDTINALEKSPVRGQIHTRYREDFGPWTAGALGILALERLVSAGRMRRLP